MIELMYIILIVVYFTFLTGLGLKKHHLQSFEVEYFATSSIQGIHCTGLLLPDSHTQVAETTRTRASFFIRFHVVTTRDYIAIGGVQVWGHC